MVVRWGLPRRAPSQAQAAHQPLDRAPRHRDDLAVDASRIFRARQT
jgi:hypothetical protein